MREGLSSEEEEEVSEVREGREERKGELGRLTREMSKRVRDGIPLPQQLSIVGDVLVLASSTASWRKTKASC